MNKILILSALVLLAGCKEDLKEEFKSSVEGVWEISSITFGESDTTVFYTGTRPRMEFFTCEKNAGMCPVYLFDQEGDMATYEYSGIFSDKEKYEGGIRFEPKLYSDLGPFNDTLQVFSAFTFSLRNDTLILSEGEISHIRFDEPRYASKDATLLLVRQP